MSLRLLLLLAVALLPLFGFADTASAAYVDVGPATLYKEAIDDLAARQIMSGYADDTFRPLDPVTRQQFAKLICKTLSVPAVHQHLAGARGHHDRPGGERVPS